MYKQFKQDIKDGKIKDPKEEYYKFPRATKYGLDQSHLLVQTEEYKNTIGQGCTSIPKPPPLPAIASTTAPGATIPNAQTSNAQTSNAQTSNAPPGGKKPLTEEEKKAANELKKKQMADLQDLLRKCDEIETMLKQKMKNPGSIPANSRLMQDAKAVTGYMDMECPSPAKIVRIFTSSTFTDTKHERNTLMRHAYPKIKEHCRKIGYEFQVVDMRWGVRDEATDDHMGTELCLKELKLCQELSTGPNFVSLLSHKYGYTAFPRVIEANEFEKITSNLSDQGTRDLFDKWYTRDDNMIPPAYILSSISTHLPDFISPDKEKQKAAKAQWWEDSGKMQDALEETAKKVFDEQTARKYIMSVTETEVQEGVLNVKDASKHSLWLKREIEDIHKQENNYALSRYMECLGPEEKFMKSRQMLKELKEDKMAKKLDPSKILNYFVNWSQDGGVNPESNDKHKLYLEQMCGDFVKYMTDMIDQSVKEKKRLIENPIADEVIQHIRFCQTKCKGFQGREDTLQKIEAYLSNPEKRQPLILHGASGTGKTSIMAVAAKQARAWMKKEAIVILRFLGTSPDSSSLMSLLHSICAQIRQAYNLPKREQLPSIELQIMDLKLVLRKGRPANPLVIILDSLDQLDPMFDARTLAWLPVAFPPNTKVIVSTLPEPEYQCFPALQAKITDKDQYIDIPTLNTDTVQHILDNWLTSRSRKLTPHQREVVLAAFQQCPTPLFLKLSFEEACMWTSFAPAEKTVLQTTVRSSIEHLFERLEKLHGKQLVSRALGYLTLAHNGATEAELEDILSCDDDVLNDVYMYWTPPMRRLPPLLLVRVRTDIDQYLVERGTDGVRVIYWYHRQFIEAAEARYCSDENLNKILHGNLADFFNGTWANGNKKPYKDQKGNIIEEDRHVSAQHLKFGEKDFNLRTLNNLPYHRIKAGQVDLLMDQCLANVDFTVTKLQALPVVSLLDDYVSAKSAFPDDKLINSILEALLLSRKGLQTDPGQYVPQLLGRLTDNDVTKDFLQRLRNYHSPYLQPSWPLLVRPGGQLVHSINAHSTDIDMMDLTGDGRFAVTVSQGEKSTIIWDVASAKQKRIVARNEQVLVALFCMDDKWILYETEKYIGVEDVESGKKHHNFKLPAGGCSNTCVCVAGKNKELIIIFCKKVCLVYDLTKDGEALRQTIIPSDPKLAFTAMSKPTGSPNYVAVLDDEQYYITVLDLKTMTFMPKFRGFAPIPMDDGDFDEYDVEYIAIHPDETHLVYTNMFNNEIVFADFHGNRLRATPPDEDLSINSLHITPDSKYLYCHSDHNFIVYDYQTLEVVENLEHNKSLLGGMTMDMKTVVTIAEDSTLKIWDLTRDKQTLLEDCTDGLFTPITAYSTCFPLGYGGYLFIVGTNGKKDPERKIGVYDVAQDKFVKLRPFFGLNEAVCKYHEADTTDSVVMVINRKPHVLDLDSMEITRPFQGIISDYVRTCTVTQKKQMVCVCRGQKNLKVYDFKTGKVDFILKGNQPQKMSEFMVNETGTLVCVTTDEGPAMLFNLEKKCHMYNIHDKGKYGEFFADHLYMDKEGTRLFFNIDVEVKETGMKDTIDHLVAWDVAEKKELVRMVDVETAKRYKKIGSDETVSIDSLHKLDEERILIIGYDNVARVHDINTGKLLNRFVGHTTSVTVGIGKNSPYLVTYGSFSEENCLILWDKNSYKQVASYNLETSMNSVYWDEEGTYFYTVTNGARNEKCAAIKWHIHNGVPQVTDVHQKKLPPIYSTKAEFDICTFTPPPKVSKDYIMEPDDPDTDPEIISDDEDEDDD